MIDTLINDRFSTDFDCMFGVPATRFKLDGDREPPKDIPPHQINRTNAHSVGRATYQHTTPCKSCGSLTRGTWSNKCKGCE
jgi:hypothetical protein